MSSFHTTLLIAALAGFALAGAAPEKTAADFHDTFKGKLGPGWTWVRERPDAWRTSDKGLEVHVQPGNMWGPANDAHNLLLRPAPDPADGEVDVSVTVTNRPTGQYEQSDLTWYFDDSHMVKCGQELVDGQLSIVMGREENDRCRTIRIIPIDSPTVTLRLLVKGNRIRGQYRTPASDKWHEVGETDLPSTARPHVCLQFYQGPRDAEHWVQVNDFRMSQKK